MKMHHEGQKEFCRNFFKPLACQNDWSKVKYDLLIFANRLPGWKSYEVGTFRRPIVKQQGWRSQTHLGRPEKLKSGTVYKPAQIFVPKLHVKWDRKTEQRTKYNK